MKISELLQKDKEALCGKPLKEKLIHIWEYYKWYLLAVFLGICFIFSLISSNIENNNIVLNGAFLNTTAYASEAIAFEQDFMSSCQLDPEKQLVVFDTSLYYRSDPDPADGTAYYETLETLIVRAHSSDIDVLVTDSDPVNILIYNEFFMDLSQVLTAEQFEAYQPYFLYIDNAFLQRILSADLSSLNPDIVLRYPDATKPELMEEPIPVLIDISTSDKIQKLYSGTNNHLVFGFISNCRHPETAGQFLDYLMK